MIDMIVYAGLLASDEVVMLPILLIGYIWFHAPLFYRITVVLMIGLILNMVCKVTFQIPLNPALGKVGFAFPSSHMQSAMILYGAIYQHYRVRWLGLCVLLILCLVAFAEHYMCYHTPRVLLAGAVVAWWLLSFPYSVLLYRYSAYIIWALVTLALGYIHFQLGIPYHVWMAYGVALGMVVAHTCLPPRADLGWWQQVLAALLSVGLFMWFSGYHTDITLLPWFGCGAILPCTRFFVGRLPFVQGICSTYYEGSE